MSPTSGPAEPTRRAPRLLFAVNSIAFLQSHRRALVAAARAEGWHVGVVCGHAADDRDWAAVQDFESLGASVTTIALNRSSMSPVDLVRTTLALRRVYREASPDVVHQVTPKIAICGSIAARLAGVPGVVTAISGLGFLFSGDSVRARLRATAARVLYGIALRHARQVIVVQNPDDQRVLAPMLPRATRFVRFFGSGVDLRRFVATPIPDGTPVVVLPARMLRDKGVLEFAEAARLLRTRGTSVRLALCGAPDPGNPSSLTEQELRALAHEGPVEYLGFQPDMAACFRGAAVACLPSAYGEGLPLALAEAAASGRAVVTTDTPGCRDTVVDGVSGRLMPARSPVALADAIESIVRDRATLERMGTASRALAEERFSLDEVTGGHLGVYHSLLQTHHARTDSTS